IHDIGLTMMITAQDHITAQAFYGQHRNAQKGKQIYLNTLAVRVVDRYLKYFGIESDLENSASSDPITQQLLDTGALHIPDVGDIECRPVLTHETSVYVPEEVHGDRLGYVAVQLDDQLENATLLGFIAEVEEEHFSLSALQPMETLLEATAPSIQVLTRLSYWLQNVVSSRWQLVEDIFARPSPTLAFRNPSDVLSSKLEKEDVIRGRLITLNKSNIDNPLLLAVGVTPSDSEELGIWVRVIPVGRSQKHLPYDLELKLLDEAGDSLMQAQSRETESIGLKFTGAVGDHFSVQVLSSDNAHIEHFII
ncbi:MAG: DUF1822 family protein, partial [Cyanobacteria bacterium J06626_14]